MTVTHLFRRYKSHFADNRFGYAACDFGGTYSHAEEEHHFRYGCLERKVVAGDHSERSENAPADIAVGVDASVDTQRDVEDNDTALDSTPYCLYEPRSGGGVPGAVGAQDDSFQPRSFKLVA